jgi:alanyl-tRNA synthetase
MKSSEIRKSFIQYFEKKNHQLVESSSLIPANDPTLLFTNAGMVQFKETFLGLEPRNYVRAVSAQRCVRAGGKHNDLENVGFTARHHTFFEMLGNFSFGDYFKREAIKYAWEFLTQELALPPEKLWITVYKEDDEAAAIWLEEIGVSPKRFSRCGEADNFWSMGDTGPCGPCTEIFYDHGPEIPGGPPGSPDQEGDRYIEIWNLVFMQFNRDKEGILHPLPKPSVDTGMGLERITAVVQGVHTNYEIDSFQELIKAILKLNPSLPHQHPSLNVIADHIRACSFLIADGVIPSNEGRGYVLRRIIRRAIRHGNKLGLPLPFFCRLVDPLAEIMGDAYPELIEAKSNISKILEQEELQFAKTLEQGLSLLQEQIASLKTKELPGNIAFKLYDTYGFPLDLTQDIAREQGLYVDEIGFNRCMQQQRDTSQAASQFTVDYTADQLEESSMFHGYEVESIKSKVSTLLVQGKKVNQITTSTKASLVLENTPFYAESGGQVGDKGQILGQDLLFEVEDTQKIGKAIVHHGHLKLGSLSVGEEVNAQVDNQRRSAIRLNHTATHLLHAALKQIIGSQVQQKGSLVDAERARFDFSNFEALTTDQIQQVETLVNDQIRANYEVVTELMDLQEAKKQGAVALFGEKYEEKVRVLSVGQFSKELCGGTHARRTGDIGLFKIISEYGVANGVRRIDMVTGMYALQWVNSQLQTLSSLAEKLKTNTSSLEEKLTQFLQESKKKEKELQNIQSKLAAKSGGDLLAEVQKYGELQVLIKKVEGVDNSGLRDILDKLKSSLEKAVIVLYTVINGKINIIAAVNKSLTGKVPSAVELVKALCGKGGGREDMAQGGGVVPEDLELRINNIVENIRANFKGI